MGVGAINFLHRGVTKKVSPPYDAQSPICIACGACQIVCPAHSKSVDFARLTRHTPRPIPAEFDEGLSHRAAAYIPFAQAVPHKPVIDAEQCLRLRTGACGACQAFCDAGAIDFEQQDTIREIDVGSIVVATGFEVFDSRRIARYGYGRLKNVLSALDFERISHASGPTSGEILTSAGQPPEAVAIIHCVGSRDEHYHEYCSRVCCMYSLKFAHLVKEKTGAEVYNCYIDMRTPGKGYEEFYKRLLHEGVQFIRGKVAEVTDVADTEEEEGKLVVVCEDTLLGLTRRLPVDMVILSAALQPGADADQVARLFSLSCAQGDFFLEKHPKLAPVEAATEGIYLAGACQGPKDIPDSVAQGAAAAACALSLADRGKYVLEPITSEIIPERCSACKTCITSCPYSAIVFDDERDVSVIIEELCKGCGTCVATCPSGAARQKGFEDVQIYAELDGILA
jgi:heterodisulfide reductase subunit A